MFDAHRGLAVTGAYNSDLQSLEWGVYRTGDGWASWQQTTFSGNDLIDVRFINAHRGWTAAWNGRQFPFYGVFFETLDGGRTWQQIWKAEERQIRDFVFVDSHLGWATANQNLILHTTECGRHWQAQDAGLPYHELLRVDGKFQMAGRHLVSWDGQDNTGKPVGAGVYLYRLETSKAAQIKKMILLR